MSKLVIFDGNAIMYRAYYALPSNMTTPKGKPINAVYGFVSMLLRVVQDLEPTHIAVAFDRKEPTFRKKLFKGYQSHRKPTESELISQFREIRNTVRTLGIPSYERAGYEADDLIGTIAKKAKVDEVVIITGDRDIMQLVDKKIKVYVPIRGLSHAKLFGEAEVKEKFGVEPARIVDLKGLMGDPSDNYKGVPGVGPKTAVSLLKKYKTFENIYKHLDELPEKQKELLTKYRESAEMSFKLAKILQNVKMKFSVEETGKWKLDSSKVIKLFQEEYGFGNLTNRVKKVGEELAASKQQSLI